MKRLNYQQNGIIIFTRTFNTLYYMSEILKSEIEKLLSNINYIYNEKFPDKQLNTLYNYWNILNKYEKDFEEEKQISLETILYSKYYWFSRLADRFYEIYGFDAGIDQQKFMIVEEIDQRLENIDWDFVEIIGKSNLT